MIILLSAADILQVCAEAGTIRKGETPLAGRKYGLDLGTMNIRIFQGGHGLVVYEKNMIAIQRKNAIEQKLGFWERLYFKYIRLF